MNTSMLPDSCFKSEQHKQMYQTKMEELQGIGKAFERMNKQLQETKKKELEQQKKKKPAPRDVVVNRATSKEEISKLSVVLKQKINEIMNGDGDTKTKTMRASLIQTKLDALGRILAQIEREQREKKQVEMEKRRGKRKSSEQVCITKEDQTLGGTKSTSGAGNSGEGFASPAVDVTLGGTSVSVSGAEGAVAVDAAPAIDVML